MYEEYWKLREKPFKNTPDPRFIYYSQKHREALSRIFYVVRERESAAVLIGEYGNGKTLLSRVLLEELSREQYQSVLIFNPRLPAIELIREIIYQLGGNASSSVSKIDLLPYVPFQADVAKENARRVQPGIEILDVSCTTGEGLDRWRAWLDGHL